MVLKLWGYHSKIVPSGQESRCFAGKLHEEAMIHHLFKELIEYQERRCYSIFEWCLGHFQETDINCHKICIILVRETILLKLF